VPVFGCSSGFWAAAKAGATGTGASESQAARPWKEIEPPHAITAWRALCGVGIIRASPACRAECRQAARKDKNARAKLLGRVLLLQPAKQLGIVVAFVGGAEPVEAVHGEPLRFRSAESGLMQEFLE
jgi:hypothetical protein